PEENIPRPPISSIYINASGLIWMGTLNGLWRFDPTEDEFIRFPVAPTLAGPDWQIQGFLPATDDLLWIASVNGLVLFDSSVGKTRRVYTEKDGLSSVFITGMLKDAEGNLWISTKKGLSRFDSVTETFINYDKVSGLQGNEFIDGSLSQSPDGRMFFGGSGGLTVFDPSNIIVNDDQTPVIFTRFELDRKST